DFDGLLKQADVVSLHVPLSDETKNLFGRETIARMKPGAILINAARGGIVDEDAVAEALDEGHLDGAALDVFGADPPDPSHPLFQSDRVVVAPHAASSTMEADERLREIVSRQVVELLEGRPPSCLINREVLERDTC